MIRDYNDLQLIENQKQLAIDFDGVIHKNSKGFFDGTIYDVPVEGSLDAIKQLSKKYDIIVFTCKAKSDRPLSCGKNGTELVWEWLIRNGFGDYVKEVTSDKPRAAYYIDDKAIKFTNWSNVLNEIK